ncbi:MAG TPA: hypothetical protein VE981_01770 [Planctomycetota bacterium]|nr:hypothetical protein [Planctomycetota bacterium]
MGPSRRRYWLPLTRLGAFFVAVVVVGNVVFHAFRPSAADFHAPDETFDYFAKKKKRLQRYFSRSMEMFLGAPRKPAAEAEAPAPVPERTLEVVQVVPPPADSGPLQAISPPAPLPKPEPVGFVPPEPAPFVWPRPFPAPRPSFVPSLDVPRSLGLSDELTFRAELVSDWYRRAEPDPLADVGDVLLRGPELLIDSIFTCTSSMSSRPAVRNWDDDDGRSLTAQMLDVDIGSRPDRIAVEFLRQLGDRERRYFANFGDSRANSFGFENGTEDADLQDLLLDQRKVFWDALRRTYLSRYKIQAEEKIKDDAWYLDRWTGADFAVLPPLLGAYVYYRGLDKKFSIAGTRLTVSIEPLSEWVRRSHDLFAAASVEWSMKDWPVGVIVSAGLHDGKYGLDFVGIGTSIGAARQVLEEKSRLAQKR